MTLGTKSLLFGVHQFLFHPLFVLWGWRIYHRRWPNWRELVCIVIHDWGYWGCKTMDGKDGKRHPIWAAEWASKHLDDHTSKGRLRYFRLCFLHSGFMAKQAQRPPSALCWPDKLGFVLMPWWLWVGLGLLSGEIKK